MKKTILLTGCGGHFMADIINCYRHIDGVEATIIGVASELTPSLRPLLDDYVQVPRCNEPGYFDLLLKLCEEKGVDILVPGLDAELIPLSLMYKRFGEIGTIVSVSQGKGLSIATDKLKLLQFLRLAGIPHPDFKEFCNDDQFAVAMNVMDGWNTRVCVKALDKAGSRGFRILDAKVDHFKSFLEEKPSGRVMSPHDFRRMYRDASEHPKLMIQEYLPGMEYSVDLLADDGKVLYMDGRLNKVVDNSIPLESELYHDAQAYEISRDIVKFLGLSGNVGIDFIYSEYKEPVPIEVNARITATIALCAAGGMNLAALQVQRLLGLPLPEVKVRYGTSVVKQMIPTYRTPEGEVLGWEK